MSYSVFNQEINDTLKEPMFFGDTVNVARFDQQKFEMFEKLTEKQLSFFWRPEEIDVSKDKIDFGKLLPNEKHIFLSNLQYQILLDSVQGRSPNIAFLPIVSLPELENWIETWSFSETIHSRSYTHIIRAIVNEPGVVFDEIISQRLVRQLRLGEIRSIPFINNYCCIFQVGFKLMCKTEKTATFVIKINNSIS